MPPQTVEVNLYVFSLLWILVLTSIKACSEDCTGVADSTGLCISGSSEPVLWKHVDQYTRIYNYSFTDYEPTAKFECVLGIDIMPHFRLIFYLDGKRVAYIEKYNGRLQHTFNLHKSNKNITCQAQRVLSPTARVYLKSVILLHYTPLSQTSTRPTVDTTWPEPENDTTEPPTTELSITSPTTTTHYPDQSSTDTDSTIDVVAMMVEMMALIVIAVLIAIITKRRIQVKLLDSKAQELERSTKPLNPPPEIKSDRK